MAEIYICANCGKAFETPSLHFEAHDPSMIGVYEKHLVSPCCGDGFFEADQCPICGELTDPKKHHGLCLKCANRAVDSLRDFLLDYCSVEELAVLDDAFDGVPLSEPEKAVVR